MSANGEAPFFNAPDFPQRDGTLVETPGETFADPVSGLVTANPEPRTAVAYGGEPPVTPVAGPVQHDPEVVRRMVEAVRERDAQGPYTPDAILPAGTTSTIGENVAPPLGVLPRQRTWPSRPPQLLRPIRPAAARQAEPIDDFEAEAEAEAVPVRKRRRVPSLTMPTIGRPSSSMAGVMLAVALLIIFGVVAIEMVSSLVSSVTGLFN